MNKIRFPRRFAASLILVCLVVGAAWAAKSVWLFQSEDQMKQTIMEHLKNPRATFYVIMRAHKRGMADEAALIYYDLLQKDRTNPQLLSAYAYSHFMATGPYSKDYFVRYASPAVQKLRPQQVQADYYREEAITFAPKSPEVLLESGLGMFYKSDTKQQGLNHVRKAVRLAPKWPDAHYWLGYLLISQWPMERDKKKRVVICREALAAFKEAERLEPKLHKECLYGTLGAYQGMDDTPKILKTMNAYLKLEPNYIKRPGIAKWRQQLQEQVKKKLKHTS
jgi:tetratricopeptide (TPR) repeat protein